jgi:hypothetical protein
MSTPTTRVSRRSFLRSGAALLVLVAGGGVYRAVDQGVFRVGQGPAYEPWTSWRGDAAEGPLQLVRAGILAANPHNSQPWLFRVTDARIDLYADTRRNLGAVDPFLREMYIGLGAALENMLLAAKALGYDATLTLVPDASDSTHAARLDLAPVPAQPSPLHDAIPRRHTDRGSYDTARPLAPETLAALRALNNEEATLDLRWFTTPAERQRVADLTVAATEAFIADPEQAHDSDSWFRLDWTQVQQHRDGLTMDTQGVSPLIAVAAKLLPAGSEAQNNATWLQATRDVHVATAAAFGLLVVRDAGELAQRMQGGRLWQRMHLWATTQGLSMQPLNQLAERADREVQLGIAPQFGDALRELVATPDWQGLMPFRIGYPTVVAGANPRRGLTEVLI